MRSSSPVVHTISEEPARVADDGNPASQSLVSDDVSSLFSRCTPVPEDEVETLDEASAVRTQRTTWIDAAVRRCHIWGSEPAYEENAEDRANWFQQLYYGWIGDFIFRAAKSSITAADLPQPQRHTRTYYTGRVLSDQVHKDLQASETWSPYVGAQIKYKGEIETSGWLRWVGYLRQSDHPRSLVAGVEWYIAPRHRRHADPNGPAGMHDGVVHGEHLFRPHQYRHQCSCEPIDCVELFPTRGVAPPPPADPDLLKSLFRAHSYHVWVQVLPKLLTDLAAVFIPVLLEYYVVYLKDDAASIGFGVTLVLGIFLTSLIQSVMGHKYDHVGQRSAALFETSSMALLFEKVLTMSRKALSLPEMSVGHIMNLVGNDVDNVATLNWYVMYFWSAPLQLGLCILLLYRLVGWCALASLVVLALTFPLQGVISKWEQEVRQEMVVVIDTRIKRTNELLSGIRIVKFMGWEPMLISLIEKARAQELQFLKKIQYAQVAFMFVDGATPILVISTVFLLYSLTGNLLEAKVVFPSIALLNTMRVPFFMIPIIVSAVLQCLVSSRRLTVFMECDDMTTSVRDIAELYQDGAAAAFDDAVVNTYGPRKLPKFKSRTTGMLQRTMMWFHRRGVPETEWVMEESESPDTGRAGAAGATEAPAAGDVGHEDARDEDDGHLHELQPKTLLHKVNAIIPNGKLTVIVGATGSGKSILLGSLLGEYEVSKGSVWVASNIAYVSQQAWIMNATLRNNILFFDEENTDKLKKVIDVCQLEADLKVLASGLETEIGEKGINLSGGQKARVSLARAVYADRDVYLLDDPLSALDAHVGSKIVEDVILGELKTKTRVLVTHQEHLLPRADHILVMSKGRVAFSGDYEAYLAAKACIAAQGENMFEEPGESDAEAEPTEDGANNEDENGSKLVQDEDSESEEPTQSGPHGFSREASENAGSARAAAGPQMRIHSTTTSVHGDDASEKSKRSDRHAEDQTGGVDVAKLMTMEEKAIGSVPWSTYKIYLEACGGLKSWGVLMAVFIVTEGVNVMNGAWLTIWVSDGLKWGSPLHYLYGYLVVVFFGMFTAPIRAYLCYQLMRIGSRNMHHSLLASVGIGTMQFFDTTPLGRILNRFTKDMGILDETLNDSYLYLLNYFFSMISTIIIMTVAQPLVLVAVLPSAFIYYKLMQIYSASNRETRRVKSIAHSPVFTMLEESVQGQRTIVIYGKTHVTMFEALQRLDVVYSALYMQNVANRWLGTRLEFIGAAIISFVALLGVVNKARGFNESDAELISFALTTALTLTETLNWLVRQVATVEANMNCVERIVHYIREIEHEDMPNMVELIDEYIAESQQRRDEKAITGARGPSQAEVIKAGSLVFDHVQMRYREGLPLVLRDVSFRIAPREKVGIVGRTGSGKSTLLLTFMRMVDVSGGSITVNGVGIRSFGLRELRKLFSMIPQDPVLFDGTVRLNVDPFFESSTEEVWSALDMVGLRDRVSSESEGVDARVQEGGANFSVGQRQLLCMARALLKKGSGFILMDEATANIDPALDRHIQKTVMRAFDEYTVITIAHRLQTVAQYDKIIVMDHGVVAEMGSPRDLADDPNSAFHAMVDSLGPAGKEEFYKAVSANPCSPITQLPK